MNNHNIARFEGVCAQSPDLALRVREEVDLDGVKSGSENSPGWPRVDTMVKKD